MNYSVAHERLHKVLEIPLTSPKLGPWCLTNVENVQISKSKIAQKMCEHELVNVWMWFRSVRFNYHSTESLDQLLNNKLAHLTLVNLTSFLRCCYVQPLFDLYGFDLIIHHGFNRNLLLSTQHLCVHMFCICNTYARCLLEIGNQMKTQLTTWDCHMQNTWISSTLKLY